MDLGRISYSSLIIPETDGRCFVQLPSFAGHVEFVSCHHETPIRYGTSLLGYRFSCDEIQHDIRQMILASQIDDMIGVRIIDTNNPYREKLFFIEQGEIFSFVLMGESYFCFIYRDIASKNQIYSNLSNPLFQIVIEDGFCMIINTLTDITVFEKELQEYQTHRIRKNSQKDDTRGKQQSSFLFARDPLCEEVNSFFDKISQISLSVSSHTIDENITRVTVDTSISDTLIGFLGSYTCILPESMKKWRDYLSERSAGDGTIQLPESFGTSDEIGFLDPRWHEFRFGLLELAYLKHLLSMHIHELKAGIIAIDALDDARVVFQGKLLSMTLEESEKMLPIFEKQYTLLLTLLKNKIS